MLALLVLLTTNEFVYRLINTFTTIIIFFIALSTVSEKLYRPQWTEQVYSRTQYSFNLTQNVSDSSSLHHHPDSNMFAGNSTNPWEPRLNLFKSIIPKLIPAARKGWCRRGVRWSHRSRPLGLLSSTR